jgi:formylmethanofuran dehydrogenase subunit D
MEMILNTIRLIKYDQGREFSFGDDLSLKENLAIGLINPKDFKKLNLSPDSNIKIISQFGEVIVKAKLDELEEVPLNIINLPISIWANQLTGIKHNELLLKNIKVNVEATTEQILDFNEILTLIKGN